MPLGRPSFRELFLVLFIGLGVGFIPVMIVDYSVVNWNLTIPTAVVYVLFVVPQLTGGLVSAYLAASRSFKNQFGFGVIAAVASMVFYLFMGLALYGFVFGGFLALLAYLMGGILGGLLHKSGVRLRRR